MMFKILSTTADADETESKSFLDKVFDFFSDLLSGIGYAIEAIFSIFN